MELLKPPQAVIYSENMEPITVVDMAPFFWEHLEKYGRVLFSINIPPSFTSWEPDQIINNSFDRVEVRADIIQRFKDRFMILTTSNEVAALLLTSSFLPGQSRQIQEERKKAFAKGFLSAMLHM